MCSTEAFQFHLKLDVYSNVRHLSLFSFHLLLDRFIHSFILICYPFYPGTLQTSHLGIKTIIPLLNRLLEGMGDKPDVKHEWNSLASSESDSYISNGWEELYTGFIVRADPVLKYLIFYSSPGSHELCTPKPWFPSPWKSRERPLWVQ